jgi:hypothetical protein
MQGAEIEYEGSVLKYMTKSEIEEQRSSLLIMTQRLIFLILHPFVIPKCNSNQNPASIHGATPNFEEEF